MLPYINIRMLMRSMWNQQILTRRAAFEYVGGLLGTATDERERRRAPPQMNIPY